MAPFDFIAMLGKFGGYFIFLLIGMGFGTALEMSGFGDSRKLAAQFYLKEMTVLKVMFTAIIVACTLIFLAASFQILDFDRVWVNTTYLWPGIVGGFIMGFGFIIGGFCPGTSIVAAATLKIDGIVFALGVIFGVWVFGESVSFFDDFWHSSNLGRFQLHEWLGLDLGIVVVLVILMALMMFYGAEICEDIFGKKIPFRDIQWLPKNRNKLIASSVLLFGALLIVIIKQPTPEKKWEWIKADLQSDLQQKLMYVHPAELLEKMQDPLLYTQILDVRSESDYNVFHLAGSQLTSLEEVREPSFVKALLKNPSNTLFVLVSNDDILATSAWKLLKAQKLFNLYILDGGINNWLATFDCMKDKKMTEVTPEKLRYQFSEAQGDRICFAHPTNVEKEQVPKLDYVKRIKIQTKQQRAGGCG